MDETFMGAKHGINGNLRLSRRRYQPVLAVLLLPSLLLIGLFSYYPAVRSLIGGFYQWNGFTPPNYVEVLDVL
jgi:ABC-type sugar transport system permease subunit